MGERDQETVTDAQPPADGRGFDGRGATDAKASAQDLSIWPSVNRTTISFVREHAAVLGAALTLTIIVGRLLAVSRLDLTVARAVVAYVDPPKVILAAIVGLAWVIGFGLVILATLWALESKRLGEPITLPIGAIGLISFLMVAISPIYVDLILLIWLVGVPVGYRWKGMATARRADESRSLTVALFALSLTLIFEPVPWLAPERIDVDAKPPVAGYVLGFSGDGSDGGHLET